MGTRTYSRRQASGQRVATPLGIQRAINSSTLKTDLYNALPAQFRQGINAGDDLNVRDIQRQLPLFPDDVRNEVQSILDEARTDAQNATAGGVQQGLMDFLNDLGRDAGAPGFFDMWLDNEPRQTPQAVQMTQQVANGVADIASRTSDLVRQMQPDLMPAQAATRAEQTLRAALNTRGITPALAEDVQRLAGMLGASFSGRQNNRIVNGLAQIASLHADVGKALARGTNAGITDAIARTSRVEDGIRTAIDTTLRGATQQDMALRRLRDMARAATNPNFPEPLRQAVLETIRTVPYRQQEKVNRAAIKAIARIGNTGVVPSILGLAQRRGLRGGAQAQVANVVETQEGINRAKQIAASRTNYSDEIDGMIRSIERASVVNRAGR